MNEVFDICVAILIWIADLFEVTYKEANIWIFVIIEPILFIAMLYMIIKQRREIKLSKNRK
jgi:hypothetical protein|tara:strand:+ start:316 stop:498 length:183 start_codon:yes stop_codon:yes gene_type:complete